MEGRKGGPLWLRLICAWVDKPCINKAITMRLRVTDSEAAWIGMMLGCPALHVVSIRFVNILASLTGFSSCAPLLGSGE